MLPICRRQGASRWVAVCALLLLGCAHDQPPLHPVGPEGRFHIVMAGETLPDIAQRAGVPLEDLAEINGLPVDGVVQSGDVIFVLAPSGLSAQPPEAPPEIEPGPAPADEGRAGEESGSRRFAWPLAKVKVTSRFGRRWGRLHEGIDLGADKGTPVLAAMAGVVLYAGSTLRGYGRMVVLQHPDDYLTAYAHNSVLLVRVGQRVRKG